MNLWDILTNPLGLAGCALLLVFGVIGVKLNERQKPWFLRVSIVLAALVIISGLYLANKQIQNSSNKVPQEIIQKTEGANSPSIVGNNNTINIYNSFDPKTKTYFDKQTRELKQKFVKTNKPDQEQQIELEKYAVRFKNIHDFVEREKNKPNGNIELATKIEILLHDGKLDEANTLLQGIPSQLTLGRVKASSTNANIK